MPPARPLPDLDAVAAIADPARRNLAITSAYGRLARAFAAATPAGANWCAFATWASHQAGQTIRSEDLGRAIVGRTQATLAALPVLRGVTTTTGITLDLFARVIAEVAPALPGIQRASTAVARGNLKVFAEIAPLFARAIPSLGSTGAWEHFLKGLAPGTSPYGQDQLRWAFEHYAEARRTADPVAGAQLMLLANIRVGLHEQARLQPEIQEALDAAVLDVDDTARALHAGVQRVMAPLGSGGGITQRLLAQVATELATHLRRVVRVVITEHLMAIDLPGGALRLGVDVARPFPPALRAVAHQGLRSTLAGFGPDVDSRRDSGAIDWAVLQQRMRFIAHFFRAWHEDASLFTPPFPPDVEEAIDAST